MLVDAHAVHVVQCPMVDVWCVVWYMSYTVCCVSICCLVSMCCVVFVVCLSCVVCCIICGMRCALRDVVCVVVSL